MPDVRDQPAIAFPRISREVLDTLFEELKRRDNFKATANFVIAQPYILDYLVRDLGSIEAAAVRLTAMGDVCQSLAVANAEGCMSHTRALFVKRELRLRMEKYGARYGSSMTVVDAVLAGIILKKYMGIPESEWEQLGLAPQPEAKLRSRVEQLEDAITEAGIILANAELDDSPQLAIRNAMKRLGSVMSDPAVLKRQGI